MNDLKGKLALVTGGAKGVGKIIAKRLVEQNAHVILNYFHSLDAAKQTKAELEAMGARVDLIRASVAIQDQVDRMFDQIEAEYGYLDILVNNAASGVFADVEHTDEAAFDRALDTNLKGSFWCARRAAALMKKRGGGSIVNLSSIGSSQVAADYLTVGTSKAALESLTRYLAYEFGQQNIRVNTASANMLDNDVARRFPAYEEMYRRVVEATPLGRIGTEEDLADLAMFLLSEQSRFMTGQMLLVDGGMSLGGSILAPRLQPELPKTEPAAPADLDEDCADIAIVGMGLVVPGAQNPEEFWDVLTEGPDLFRYIPRDRWENNSFYSSDATAEDKTYQNTSGFITDFVPDTNTELTTFWLRHSLQQSLEGVKLQADDKFSFVVGYTPDGNQNLEESMIINSTLHHLNQIVEEMEATPAEKQAILEQASKALQKEFARGAVPVSELLPHRVGHNAMRDVLPEDTELTLVDTACSSSLYAVDIGIKGLLTGEHDVAVCGGAFALGPRSSVLFAKLHGLSTSGQVRPLDKAADGVLFSDGAGVVVLKKLNRAKRDGDRILGVVKAFGASSDGKGKAIYAPSPDGQGLAIERALAQPAVELDNVDWVIAHATGTPAGDLTEFTALRNKLSADHPIYVTSNKSLIGHTGWAAGVVSLIQVLMSLQKGVITPQHRFDTPPDLFGIESSNLTIPKSPVVWESKGSKPRTAAISGFGFGGTNAHLVVEEYRPDTQSTPAPKLDESDRIAIVGWAAHVPGLDSSQEITQWLKGAGKFPQATFGEFYPEPSFQKVRMPPRTVRTIDRCQLMILECSHNLRDQLGEFWDGNKTSTGVIMGHMGLTRHSTLYGSRVYLDDVVRVLREHVESRLLEESIDGLRREVKRLVISSNEDSFPGIMPNVIPARVANYFDLKGLNMAIDTGFESSFSALEVACRYLRSHELNMALVGGLHGNTTPENIQAIRELLHNPSLEIAEGCFMFALVRESTAVAGGLPVLGFLEDGKASETTKATDVECGISGANTNYMGAEGALGLLKALIQRQPETTVVCKTEEGERAKTLRLTVPHPPSDQPKQTRVPDAFFKTDEWAPGQALELERHVATLAPVTGTVVRAGQSFLSPDTLVITDRPELMTAYADRAVILSSEPATTGIHHLPEITQEAVQAFLSQLGRSFKHIRVVSDLNLSAPVPDCLSEAPTRLLKLHDLSFLVLKCCFDALAEDGSSYLTLLLNSSPSGVLHPYSGLFGGLTKSAALELPNSVILLVQTDDANVQDGMAKAEQESRYAQLLPLVAYQDGVRKTTVVEQVAGVLPADGLATIDESSLVVATAGARGITAELLKAVAQHFRPTLYIIGRNSLDQYPEHVFQGTEAEFAARRKDYLREHKAAHPQKTLGQLNKEFDRMAEARSARQNLQAMIAHCGSEKVRYIACDVTNRADLTRAFEIIHREQKRPIDLLINAAGLNRSAATPVKQLGDFRAIRDIKIQGYLNLKHVLKNHPPRLWCNFGSFIGLTGQLGETDYASANNFLSTAASFVSQTQGNDEFTIGWTLWKSVGLGANPLTKSFLEKSALFTSMCTEEGIHHFIREISLAQRASETFHLGTAEKNAITRVIPDFFQGRVAPTKAAVPTHSFYLDRELSRTSKEVVFERVFDLEKDAYLRHHVVNGFATLPGTFVPEIAAEAALALYPEQQVIAFEDVVFHHFLRVYDKSKPSTKKIKATILEQTPHQTKVQVLVLTDIVAPNGTVLVRDKLHFEAKVILSGEVPPAPHWSHWDSRGEQFIPDPYHFPKAPVLLTDMFVSTTNTRQHPLGKRATYELGVESNDPVFSSFLIPSIMLDGLARVAVLGYVEGEYLPLAAPARIRRIDMYETGSDCHFAEKYASIELYATPRNIDLEQDSSNRFVAVNPEGKIIFQMHDVTGTVLGYCHSVSGDFLQQLPTSHSVS
ncbi:SDR family oxidoreductase [Tumebacillus permanentifrigoris]|uniref:Beta-ketoacyl synthase-like protein n=1 Tax=Tumebacillus permanentifrigoris TaxID=378543 RepID=A0A316DAS6_9BACL|nr:SDR family oxidoreductase [Tumebacillus permanentifrigoris]PWK13932.1 beta-ketoacyl synthase-like protein [Tumebacillus permanentifrigoris]